MLRPIAYWYSLILSTLLSLAFFAYFIMAYYIFTTYTEYEINKPVFAVIIILAMSVLSILAAIWFGWRLERRAVRSLQQEVTGLLSEVRSLELQLITAQKSAGPLPPPPEPPM